MLRALASVVALSSLLLACGGETTDDSPGSAGSAGTTNLAGSAGDGGSPGTAGTSAGSAGSVSTAGSAGDTGSGGAAAVVDCANLLGNPSNVNGSCGTEGEGCGHCDHPSGSLYVCNEGHWHNNLAGFCEDGMSGNGGASGCGDSDSCTGTTTCGDPCTRFFDEGFCGGNTAHGVCNGHGQCETFGPPACAKEPCQAKVCGDACSLGGTKGQCDSSGSCSLAGEPVACNDYDPCAGKGCGDACDFCPPNADCAGPIGQCTSKGQCKQNLPAGCFNCVEDADCYVNEPSKVCTDGSTVSGSATCTQKKCVYGPFDCGPPQCQARDIKGAPDCSTSLGWAWDGSSCKEILGCACVGADCGSGALFSSPGACNEALSPCMLD